MANGYNAGDLNITIQTISAETIKSLDAVIERLSLIDKGLGGIKGSSYIRKSAKTPKSNGGGFGFAKLGISLHLMRRMGRFMANLVQAGSDYNETLNLWQVAMRNNLDVADQFVNKMQKAYGISSKTLMNAQAIFKNMIGSLGQISDQTAYALSEALVQMSADFASLYNVQLDQAFSKMQAMLAGQVRPIRSAGLDMTETTLFMFYQQLGGTKTMRQLNRTEKQLLSILAVYQQMGSAGALGDMSKTLNQFANQSRMMTEYWAELKTWTGLVLKDLIDQSGALIYINAALITMTEVVKAIAKSRGLGDENFLTGLFETADATNDAVDELQGKLLDFDKFRSLEGATASPLAIDEKLLQAISGYSSKIDQAENAAQKLAESWMSVLGFTKDVNGEFIITEENITKIENVIKGIVIAVSAFLGLGILSFLINIIKGFGVLFSTTGLVIIAISSLTMGIISLINAWGDMSQASKLVTIFVTLAAAIAGAAVGIALFYGNWAKALAIPAIVAGATLTVMANSKAVREAKMPDFYANGASDIDGGTLFVAGEMGKTEAVYTGSNGKTNVANVRQMEQAFYNALSRHSREGNGTIVVQTYLDGEKVYENTTAKAKSRGNVWAKV